MENSGIDNKNLRDLIELLSPKEKRYINLHLKKNKETRFLSLFIVLTKPHEDISEKLKPIPKSNFSVLKVQLYYKILEGLQQFHAKTNVNLIKSSLIAQYEILYKKGLYNQAYKVLLKAKKLCETNGIYYELIYISNELLKIENFNKSSAKLEQSISNYNKNTQKSLKVIKQNSLLIKNYYQNLMAIDFFSPSTDFNAIKIINSYALKLDETEISDEFTHFLKNLNLALYYLFLGDLRQTKTLISEIFAYLSKHDKQIDYLPINFIEIIEIIFESFITTNNIHELISFLNLLQQNKVKNKVIETLLIYKNTLEAINEKRTSGLQKYTDKLIELNTGSNSRFLFITYIQIIKHHFILKEYKQCFKWINKVFEEFEITYKPEIQLTLIHLKLVTIIILNKIDLLQLEFKHLNALAKSTGVENNYNELLMNSINNVTKSNSGNIIKNKKHFLENLKECLKLAEYKNHYSTIFDLNLLIN